jgi:ankyrin repeat protein
MADEVIPVAENILVQVNFEQDIVPPFAFRINKKNTKMQRIFQAVAGHLTTEVMSLTFYFNGQLLTGDMTAAVLEMKELDEIDCMYALGFKAPLPNTNQRFAQAAKVGDCRLLESLLAFVEIDAEDPMLHATALMHAARNNCAEACNFLLENGATLDLQSREGYTALSGASFYGHFSTCILLLDKGASINLKDKWKYTSLLHAFQHGHLQVCQLLLSRGATIDHLVDYEGKTCFDIAKEGPCRDLLRDHVNAELEAAAMTARAVATGSIFVVPVCVICLEEPKVW